MMKHAVLCAAGALSLLASSALANDRYQSRPPVIVSPDLTAPWVTQLGGGNVQPVVYPVRPGARRRRRFGSPSSVKYAVGAPRRCDHIDQGYL